MQQYVPLILADLHCCPGPDAWPPCCFPALASAMISNASSPMQYKMVPYKTLSGLDPTLCFGLQRSNQRLLALNDGLEDEVPPPFPGLDVQTLQSQQPPRKSNSPTNLTIPGSNSEEA